MNERCLCIRKDGGSPVLEIGTECRRGKQPKLRLDMWRNTHDVLDIKAGHQLALRLVFASYKLVHLVIPRLGVRDILGEKLHEDRVVHVLALKFRDRHDIFQRPSRLDTSDRVGGRKNSGGYARGLSW